MSDFLRNALSLESNACVSAGTNLENELALESATIEINAADTELTMAGHQVDEVTRAHLTLEDISASLESLVEEDSRGLDRHAAKGYTMAVEAVLGGALPNPVASLESFGGESECSEATTLSLEGIKDTLKKLWEGIKRSIANAIRAVGDFFATLFGGVKKLKARIEDVRKEVAEAKKANKVTEGKAIIAGGSKLALGGKASESEIEEGAKIIKADLVSSSDGLAKVATEYYGDIVGFYTSKKDPDAIQGLIGSGATSITKAITKVTDTELPGGKTWEYVTTQATDESEKDTASAPKLIDFPGRKKYKEVEANVPSLDFIDARLSDAMDIVTQLEKSESSREKLKTAREAASAAADKWYQKSDKDLDAKWTAAKVSIALRFPNVDLAAPVAKSDSLAFSYTRALVSSMSSSLAQYKEPKKA